MNEYYKQDEILQLRKDVELALLDYLVEVDATREEIIDMISKMDINDDAKYLHMTAIRIIANAAAPYSETYRILQLSKQQHAEFLEGDDS